MLSDFGIRTSDCRLVDRLKPCISLPSCALLVCAMPSSALGRLQLLSSDGITDRQSFPLLHSTVTFGRAQSCDIRLQLPSVSKQHCELRIHENRTAKIHVFSVNGVRAGLSVWRRGEIGHLENGDSFVIAGKTFRMELGTIDLASEVQVRRRASSSPCSRSPTVTTQTPARTAPLRYSMIAAANVNTPSREAPMSQQPRRSWVASLVSPFGFGPAPSQHQSVHQHMEDLISLMDPEPLPQRVSSPTSEARAVLT